MTNDEDQTSAFDFVIWGFVIPSTFDIRASSFFDGRLPAAADETRYANG
jgi:hypothetical protein